MYKMRLSGGSTTKIVSPDEMAIGQIGKIVERGFGYKDDIVLRAYDHLISLTNPNSTWTIGRSLSPSFGIELLPEGQTVELTSGKAAKR